MKDSLRSYISYVLRGMLMGAADVIPGVSGGTVALIVGIYERLIGGIANISKEALPALRSGGLRKAWKVIDGNFLLSVLIGIAISFLTLAQVITWMLEHYPQLLWSFFFGLVAASCVFIGRMVKQWKISIVAAFVIATVATFAITSAAPAATPNGLWFIFLSGCIAISAMILPGISGSFILVLLSKYGYMLEAIHSRNIPVVLVFIAGCAVGIMTASRVISWLFKRYHDLALSVIVGIMLGSLNKIWPWKRTLEWREHSDGTMEPVVQQNIWPNEYLSASGDQPYVLAAVLLALFGVLVIVGVEYAGSKNSVSSKKENDVVS